ncbi:MAG: phosphopantetheine-binding protein [Anaerocolumna sp.]
MIMKLDYEHFVRLLKDKLPPNFKDLEIKPYYTLKEDLLLNSILFYSLLVDIEMAFNITFKTVTMDANEYRTVGNLTEYINCLLEEATNEG